MSGSGAGVNREVPATAFDGGLDVVDFLFEVDDLLLELGVLVVDVCLVGCLAGDCDFSLVAVLVVEDQRTSHRVANDLDELFGAGAATASADFHPNFTVPGEELVGVGVNPQVTADVLGAFGCYRLEVNFGVAVAARVDLGPSVASPDVQVVGVAVDPEVARTQVF